MIAKREDGETHVGKRHHVRQVQVPLHTYPRILSHSHKKAWSITEWTTCGNHQHGKCYFSHIDWTTTSRHEQCIILVKQFQTTSDEIEAFSYLKGKYFNWNLIIPIENHVPPVKKLLDKGLAAFWLEFALRTLDLENGLNSEVSVGTCRSSCVIV